MRFGVLGPLVAEGAHGPVDLKGPRHRAVLARLLIAKGRVVPVDRLIDDLWDVPPNRAAGVLQTFVFDLRRALEPDRPPRTPARLLISAAPGYALRLDPDALDTTRFETAVTAPPDLARLDAALELWRGPAYAEFADQAWARAEITRLNELRLLAVERRAQALLDLGRAADAVPALEAHLDDHPWREDAWRLLALACYRTGRQADALDTLRRARDILATELGLDPGPALRQLETDLLTQAGHLNPATSASPLVGRTAELDELATTANGLVLISGEAGAGKTALATAFREQLARRGWTTAWATNPDTDAQPAAWPWTQLLRTLAGPEPEPDDDDPVLARFHWHQAVRDFLARRAPLALVLDDLHWAGQETLDLLAATMAEPNPVLLIGTYRSTDIGPRLAGFLGRAARVEPLRIYLGGLPRPEVAELVHDTIGRTVDEPTAELIHRRSGGNPFFVRELARLWDTSGELTDIPAGVRDVVRHRMSTLPDSVRTALRQASVIGNDIDPGLLGPDALDALETAAANGFLIERGPGRFQFAHALVRDTLYQDLSHSRRARLHAGIAETIERSRPDDSEALAHHFGSAELPRRAAPYAHAAARAAENRFAPHEAAQWFRVALAGADEIRTRLDLIMGLVRTLAVTGGLAEARRHRAEAITLAESLDDPELTTQVIIAFDVPAIWTTHDDPELAARIARITEKALATLPPERQAERSRLLATLALELRDTGGDRAREAAREAESIARELDEPAVLAFALNARFIQSFDRAGRAPERIEIGAELVELATKHELISFAVLGQLILMQAHSALAEFDRADRHAEAADRLGRDYRIPLVTVFTDWYRALRLAVAGHRDRAEKAYRAAARNLSGTGMTGMDQGILDLALRSLGRQHDQALPDIVLDPLYEARLCVHAEAAIKADDPQKMEQIYQELLPAANELAGAGSGMLSFGPVARYLDDLRAKAADRRGPRRIPSRSRPTGAA